MNYRYAGRQKTLHFGIWPEVGWQPRAICAPPRERRLGIWNPGAIEKQLAHLDTSMVRRAYTRGEYWDERVKMMQHWSDYLDQLRDGAKVLRPQFGKR